VPRFACFIETSDQPVTPDHPVWSLPLPSNRQWTPQGLRAEPAAAPSVGDYFGAVQLFLEGPARDAIAQQIAQRGAESAYPESFRIYLAKHGEFYHPACVTADDAGNGFRWVVNVAVSPAGHGLIRREYALLAKLARQCRPVYVPEVYAFAEMQTAGGLSLPMFLGEWFSGYHEFHLTRSAPRGETALVLWNPESGHCLLDRQQAEKLYCRAARILTHYFNPSSFECIGAWHHAAGDFVARLSSLDVDVRLVTVREYASLFRSRHDRERPEPDIRALLEALLVFLLQVGIRMRLDRLDGIGQIAWSGPEAVGGTLAGVLEALADKPAPAGPPLDLLFGRYLASCAEEDLLDLSRDIAARSFRPDAPELPIVLSRLPEHAADLMEAILKL
jgi:hypothetical protein